MSQLYKIADALGDKSANVIFIHGLGGDPYATWRYGLAGDGLWPKWLAADVPGLAIYSLGYEAAVSRWRGAAMHLPDRAKNVLEQFLVQPDLAQGALYLIGHSLGGLVIKQLLRTAESEAKFRPEAAELLARVEKIAFFGTPHAGAGQATLGDRLRILVRPSEATSSLVRNDPYLRNLNNWYRDWANGRAVPHLILSETQPTRFLGMLVPADTSDPGLANVHAVPIGANHIGICKPIDKNHEIYLQVRAFIERVVVPRVDPIISKVDKLPDEIVAKLITELETRGGLQRAEGGGLERQTVITLARRLKPDDTFDFDGAVAELENAITIALDVIARGRRGSNEDQFVSEVLKTVAAHTQTGENERAIKVLDDALKELDLRELEQRESLKRSRLTLLEAGIRQDILGRNAVSVAERVAQVSAIEHPADMDARLRALREKYDEFHIPGRDKGVNLSLEIAVEIARQRVGLAHGAHDRSAALNILGVSLRELGERESGTARLEQAVSAYRQALTELTREGFPVDWAMIQANLGAALGTLGERERDTRRLSEAVEAFREALQSDSSELGSSRRAMIQTNLANTLAILGQSDSGTNQLAEAVTAFREVLKHWTREREPLKWAGTQNNLCNALVILGKRETDTAHLREGVAAAREALEELPRDQRPLDWAKTQHNLASALMALGERERSTALLLEAVAAFRSALEVFEAANTGYYVDRSTSALAHAEVLLAQHRKNR
jgi:tetratricopeptide (TPR) repeat protein